MRDAHEEMLYWWGIHEDLCDIWSDDDDWDDVMKRFRDYVKPLFNNGETITPEYAGEYVRAMFIYSFRDYMRSIS